MNSTHRAFRVWISASAFLAVIGMGGGLVFSARAAEPEGAKVIGLLGLAQYATAGGNYMPLKVGTVLHAGDLVQTATGSALDLDFGRAVGKLRLLQSTTMGLPTLSPSEVRLELRGGEVLGQLKKRPNAKFDIEVPMGIAGIIEGDFRLNARGYLVVVDGTAILVEAPPTGDPVAHTLSSRPTPVYFSPAEHGVRPAVKELVREVRGQLNAKVPKK